MHKVYSIGLLLVLILAVSCKQASEEKYSGWKVYGGTKENIHYSSLKIIDTGNVGRLTQAWIYHTRDADTISQIQVNPVMIDGVLYGVSPKLKLFAVDAATGQPHWVFDPAKQQATYFAINACRGVAYYKGTGNDQRLF